MEHIDMNFSSESQLQIGYICSIRIFSRNRDIVDKLHLNQNPCVDLVGFNDDPDTMTATDLNPDMLQSRSNNASLGFILVGI